MREGCALQNREGKETEEDYKGKVEKAKERTDPREDAAGSWQRSSQEAGASKGKELKQSIEHLNKSTKPQAGFYSEL